MGKTGLPVFSPAQFVVGLHSFPQSHRLGTEDLACLAMNSPEGTLVRERARPGDESWLCHLIVYDLGHVAYQQ